jgi:nitroimidazol reductase NimA-like FMN-containing flavoprotein (pyridoxamine 5'-phosphate oxidase superfamily)
MSSVDGDWSRAETEQFLEEAVVPVRIGCHNPGGGLWMLSLWYRHREGTIECATQQSADIVSFLRQDGEVCFEVSTNRPPYMGVRGKGTATVEATGGKEILRALLERYIGTTDAEIGRMLLREDREEAAIRIEPSRLYTWDFTPRMGEDTRDSPATTQSEPPSPRYG